MSDENDIGEILFFYLKGVRVDNSLSGNFESIMSKPVYVFHHREPLVCGVSHKCAVELYHIGFFEGKDDVRVLDGTAENE